MSGMVGVVIAVLDLAAAFFLGSPDQVTWVLLIFLSVLLLGFFTWEVGLIRIYGPHHELKRFQSVLNKAKHMFFSTLISSKR